MDAQCVLDLTDYLTCLVLVGAVMFLVGFACRGHKR
ncbi:hypothetical protein [Caulobacter phage KSC]|uniref:Uncharacterized protein n=1 Tax=Caulobacter phage KSC TaxID=3020398 RepID=A0AAE9X2W3_9CAUD|nr:hypothetical protein [Caulobacter phage KSC]